MFRKLHTTKINDYASERGTGSGSASSSEHAIGSDGSVRDGQYGANIYIADIQMYDFALNETAVKFL
jgi:hypothetical protein